MDTPTKVETLREKALRLFGERFQEDECKNREYEAVLTSKRRANLDKAMKSVFGDDVIYSVKPDDGDFDFWAIVDGIPELQFAENRETYAGRDHLIAKPNYTFSPGSDLDSAEFEEWYENPLNKHLNDSSRVGDLSKVGELLTRWHDLDRIVKPWPSKVSTAPAKPKRFEVLTFSQVNAEPRPFRVLNTLNDCDGNLEFVIEYTDIAAS